MPARFPKPEFWSRLSSADAKRIADAGELALEDAVYLSRLVQKTLSQFLTEEVGPTISPTTKISLAGVRQHLRALIAIDARELEAMSAEFPSLRRRADKNLRYNLESIVVEIDDLIGRDERGRPPSDGERFSKLAESLLHSWCELAGREIASADCSPAKEYYRLVLPRLELPGNDRRKPAELTWGKPGETLADCVLDAMRLAIRRLKRRDAEP